MRGAWGVVADACCVLVFVVAGRANHHAGETLAGVASTAWPFLTGLAVGELAARAWRCPLTLAPAGLSAWLGAVALGQLLRLVSGQGTDAAFVGVSAAFLGLFLLGWRVAVRAAFRLTRHPRS